MHNNPINLIDPTGMIAYPPQEGSFTNGDVHTDSDGSWTFHEELGMIIHWERTIFYKQ